MYGHHVKHLYIYVCRCKQSKTLLAFKTPIFSLLFYRNLALWQCQGRPTRLKRDTVVFPSLSRSFSTLLSHGTYKRQDSRARPILHRPKGVCGRASEPTQSAGSKGCPEGLGGERTGVAAEVSQTSSNKQSCSDRKKETECSYNTELVAPLAQLTKIIIFFCLRND